MKRSLDHNTSVSPLKMIQAHKPDIKELKQLLGYQPKHRRQD